jgi:hypothetical protein
MPKKTTQPAANPEPRHTEAHMNSMDIAAIVTRIVGIYAFIHSLDYIQVISWTIIRAPEGASVPWFPLLLSVLIFIILVGAGIYLFFAPRRLAAFLVHESFADEHVLTGGAVEIQTAAFAIVGLIVALRGVSSLARMISFLLSRPEPHGGLPANTVGDLVVAIVGLFLGLYLLVDSRGVVNIVKRIRGE